MMRVATAGEVHKFREERRPEVGEIAVRGARCRPGTASTKPTATG